MSFEMDGEAEDPFAEASEPDEDTSEDAQDEAVEFDEANVEPGHEPAATTATGQVSGSQKTTEIDDSDRGVTVHDLTVGDDVRPEVIAQALTDPAYTRENPPVPYAVWREGVSVGRGKKTLDINDDLDELVKQVERQFEARYGVEVFKADIRELAMAYGLMHPEALFEMMSEWGIEYDKR